jgi:hypothetical protein
MLGLIAVSITARGNGPSPPLGKSPAWGRLADGHCRSGMGQALYDASSRWRSRNGTVACIVRRSPPLAACSPR